MKKFTKLAMLAVVGSSLFLSACGTEASSVTPSSSSPSSSTSGSSSASSASTTPSSDPVNEGFEIALITDIGDIDDKSFNQGSWEGVVAFAEENNKTYQYYRPTRQGTDEYLDAIELAVSNGAKIIVTPGFLFETPIYFAQDDFPDTNFILLDGVPNDGNWGGPTGPDFRTEDNVMSILYAEEQAGFLAGYAAVLEGYRSLGFMGGLAVPAVVRFGIGFAQGAQAAALELNLADDAVTLRYHYTGDFAANTKNRATADTMYQQGVEVIFAAGGAVGQSVMAAAEAADKKVIGVDIDQGGDSDTVITSALKGLGASVQQALAEYFDDEFRGGETVVFDASNDGVGLPTGTESFRFEEFTVAQYEAIFADLADGTIVVEKDLELGEEPAITGAFNTTLTKVALTWVA
jgi:basic membrane protein A and related proteins